MFEMTLSMASRIAFFTRGTSATLATPEKEKSMSGGSTQNTFTAPTSGISPSKGSSRRVASTEAFTCEMPAVIKPTDMAMSTFES